MSPEGSTDTDDDSLPEDKDEDCAQPQDIWKMRTEDLDE